MNTLRVRTPEERRRVRQIAALRARNAFVELLCIASVLRTALTEILPLTGCGGWWVTALLLLPGCAVYALFRLCMSLTRTDTLTDCLRCCLGPLGGWLLSGVLTALLLLDGAASMTALITLFTEGIGTRGTQVTLALLTSAVLLFSLHREGLPRAVYLLRPVMLVSAALAAVILAQEARIDALFPWKGEGDSSLVAALQTGVSLGWPVTLLLTVPSAENPRRVRPAVKVLLATVLPLLFVTLILPHEILTEARDLAGSLLLPMLYAPSALRTLCLCLLMLILFLAAGGAAQFATEHLCAPMGQPPRFLPYAVLLLLTATQALDVGRLWAALTAIMPWMLVPLALLAVLCLPIACFRRKPT